MSPLLNLFQGMVYSYPFRLHHVSKLLRNHRPDGLFNQRWVKIKRRFFIQLVHLEFWWGWEFGIPIMFRQIKKIYIPGD